MADVYAATMCLATERPAYGLTWPPGERLATSAARSEAKGLLAPAERPERELYLGEVRDAAMPAGVVCPNCSDRQVVLYGKRAGLQRYRCNACRRTFTELTGTVLHGLRRRDLWLRFSRCLMEGLTVRDAAARLGIAKNTSFAWRHRAIAALASADSRDTCEGVVEIAQWPILHSFKGSRVPQEARMGHLKRVFRRYHQAYSHLLPASRLATMVVALDRGGRTRAVVTARHENLTPALLKMVSADAEICASRRHGYLNLRVDWPGRVHWLDGNHNRVSPTGSVECVPIYHVRNARRLMSGFQSWLAGFLGVATKYMLRYFSWYLRCAALASTQLDVAAKLLLGEVIRA